MKNEIETANDSTQANKNPVNISSSLLKQILLGLSFLVIAVAGVYLIFSTDMVFKSTILEQEKIKLEADIEALVNENYILRQKLERLQTDPGYVEDQARKKLGLIRPGEIIFRLSEEPDLGDNTPSPTP